MPNWCENIVSARHKDKDQAVRLAKAANEGRLFTEFRPLPEDKKEDWYDWCLENWGTKWDIDPLDTDSDVVQDGDMYLVRVRFLTAWGPCLNFFRFLKSQGWCVSATYAEPCLNFIGYWTTDGSDFEWCIDDQDVPMFVREEYPEYYAEEID